MAITPPTNRFRGKWDFIPSLDWDTPILTETERDCDCARRAMIWYGFRKMQTKTGQGWYIWKLPNENSINSPA